MENTKTIFEDWFNSTNKVVDDWKNFQNQFNGDQSKMWDTVGKMQQQWLDGYQSMANRFASSVPGSGSNPFTDKTAQDAFSNMLKSMDIYTRLFQLWQPVFNQMQTGSFNPQDLWKNVDPTSFRAFTDKLFGLDQNEMMKGFMNQYSQMMNFWTNTSGNSNNGFFNSMSQMNPQSVSNWYSDMFRSYQRSFTPFFAQTSTGNSSDGTPMSEVTDRWNKYLNKVNEMQALLYKTGMSAWEKTVQEMNNLSNENKAFTSFDEFYNHWSAINEKEYVALFNTEEYAVLQAELMKMQTELSKVYEKQMEALLQPYPVVLRSQLEEVYKTNHELRGRINELERTLTELQDFIKAYTSEAAKASKSKS